MQALLEQQVLPETSAILASSSEEASDVGRDSVVSKVIIPLVKVRLFCLSLAVLWPAARSQRLPASLQAMSTSNSQLICCSVVLQSIVHSLADLAGAEVSLLRGGQDRSQNQVEPSEVALQQQEEQSKEPRQTGHAEAADDSYCPRPAAAAEGIVPLSSSGTAGSSNPAAAISRMQQDMVYLTMLLSSRNLSMRPAVLEAPAQDPQYLEAIHQVSGRSERFIRRRSSSAPHYDAQTSRCCRPDCAQRWCICLRCIINVLLLFCLLSCLPCTAPGPVSICQVLHVRTGALLQPQPSGAPSARVIAAAAACLGG